MDNNVKEYWRNFTLNDYCAKMSSDVFDRAWEGRKEHGPGFKGEPLDHAWQEMLDLAYYLYAAQRQFASCDPNAKTAGMNALAKQLHQAAADNGWHDKERSFGDECALIHSEVSEALEAYRKDGDPASHEVQEELADVLIRVLDVVGKYEIDIEGAVRAKILKNSERPYRHGGKAL